MHAREWRGREGSARCGWVDTGCVDGHLLEGETQRKDRRRRLFDAHLESLYLDYRWRGRYSAGATTPSFSTAPLSHSSSWAAPVAPPAPGPLSVAPTVTATVPSSTTPVAAAVGGVTTATDAFPAVEGGQPKPPPPPPQAEQRDAEAALGERARDSVTTSASSSEVLAKTEPLPRPPPLLPPRKEDKAAALHASAGDPSRVSMSPQISLMSDDAPTTLALLDRNASEPPLNPPALSFAATAAADATSTFATLPSLPTPPPTAPADGGSSGSTSSDAYASATPPARARAICDSDGTSTAPVPGGQAGSGPGLGGEVTCAEGDVRPLLSPSWAAFFGRSDALGSSDDGPSGVTAHSRGSIEVDGEPDGHGTSGAGGDLSPAVGGPSACEGTLPNERVGGATEGELAALEVDSDTTADSSAVRKNDRGDAKTDSDDGDNGADALKVNGLTSMPGNTADAMELPAERSEQLLSSPAAAAATEAPHPLLLLPTPIAALADDTLTASPAPMASSSAPPPSLPAPAVAPGEVETVTCADIPAPDFPPLMRPTDNQHRHAGHYRSHDHHCTQPLDNHSTREAARRRSGSHSSGGIAVEYSDTGCSSNSIGSRIHDPSSSEIEPADDCTREQPSAFSAPPELLLPQKCSGPDSSSGNCNRETGPALALSSSPSGPRSSDEHDGQDITGHGPVLCAAVGNPPTTAAISVAPAMQSVPYVFLPTEATPAPTEDGQMAGHAVGNHLGSSSSLAGHPSPPHVPPAPALLVSAQSVDAISAPTVLPPPADDPPPPTSRPPSPPPPLPDSRSLTATPTPPFQPLASARPLASDSPAVSAVGAGTSMQGITAAGFASPPPIVSPPGDGDDTSSSVDLAGGLHHRVVEFAQLGAADAWAAAVGLAAGRLRLDGSSGGAGGWAIGMMAAERRGNRLRQRHPGDAAQEKGAQADITPPIPVVEAAEMGAGIGPSVPASGTAPGEKETDEGKSGRTPSPCANGQRPADGQRQSVGGRSTAIECQGASRPRHEFAIPEALPPSASARSASMAIAAIALNPTSAIAPTTRSNPGSPVAARPGHPPPRPNSTPPNASSDDEEEARAVTDERAGTRGNARGNPDSRPWLLASYQFLAPQAALAGVVPLELSTAEATTTTSPRDTVAPMHLGTSPPPSPLSTLPSPPPPPPRPPPQLPPAGAAPCVRISTDNEAVQHKTDASYHQDEATKPGTAVIHQDPPPLELPSRLQPNARRASASVALASEPPIQPLPTPPPTGSLLSTARAGAGAGVAGISFGPSASIRLPAWPASAAVFTSTNVTVLAGLHSKWPAADAAQLSLPAPPAHHLLIPPPPVMPAASAMSGTSNAATGSVAPLAGPPSSSLSASVPPPLLRPPPPLPLIPADAVADAARAALVLPRHPPPPSPIRSTVNAAAVGVVLSARNPRGDRDATSPPPGDPGDSFRASLPAWRSDDVPTPLSTPFPHGPLQIVHTLAPMKDRCLLFRVAMSWRVEVRGHIFRRRVRNVLLSLR